ncbi:type II toxin-antitoxin system RelE/ParE family toxin [Planomonospora sp. ID82291]|uniref:type II toxin-antitoxin system RelE/ParE family toxin n=1 Tax=Planomonospora sp. ID82291 TaxID=2738136 RepID=UPI0018C3C509|nr:type II toxin-antitoxin system RelE/ParE family toxin [Planomonospora sp. ID82291]MBG0812927.1 type II toxin-antitoxin system RelE/ParE family toxin [Planomonospora sp. ID82291]
MASWEVVLVVEVRQWFDRLCEEDWESAEQVEDAIDMLARVGPTLGRPLVDRLKGSDNHHLKELRPGSSGSSEIRIIFAFDPVRRAVLLVAGDKSGNWTRWYDENIVIAEKRYAQHVTELSTREYE